MNRLGAGAALRRLQRAALLAGEEFRRVVAERAAMLLAVMLGMRLGPAFMPVVVMAMALVAGAGQPIRGHRADDHRCDRVIRDLAGDGDHYAATVISESFRGKSRVQQHQIVYQSLKGQMGGVLHALALQTGVPE